MPAIDLVGHRFDRLLVVARAPRKPEHGKRAAWRCRCDCGRESVVTGHNLRGSKVKSCGCLRDDKSRARHLTHGEARSRTKRVRASREYRAWGAMKTRCYNKKQPSYPHYGGRGIRVCERWRESFTAFLADMGRCPPNRTLDRIETSGHYEPNNCRWVMPITQANNKRSNHRIAFRGESRTVAEWERTLGFKPGKLKARLLRGWSLERALVP